MHRQSLIAVAVLAALAAGLPARPTVAQPSSGARAPAPATVRAPQSPWEYRPATGVQGPAIAHAGEPDGSMHESALLIARCDPGTAGSLYLVVPGGMPVFDLVGRPTTVTLAIGTKQFTLRATPATDVGPVYIDVPMRPDAPLFDSIATGRAMRVIAATGEMTLTLQGAGRVVEEWRAACARLAGGPAVPPAPGGTPAPARPGAESAWPSAPQASPPPRPAAVPEAELRNRVRRYLVGRGYTNSRDYAVTLLDLNDDGVQEALIAFDNLQDCGTGGCAMMALDLSGSSPRVILDGFLGFGLTPLQTRSGGWRDLALGGRDGSGTLQYRNGRYDLTRPARR